MRIDSKLFSDAPGAKLRPGLLPFPRLLIHATILCTLAGLLGAGWWAAQVGKGVGWDQMNYHHYNVYAWLHGVMDHHLAPAGMHSWINPLLYLPAYMMVNHLPPWLTGFLFGALAGLNLGLLFALGCLALRREIVTQSPLFVAIIGVTSGVVGLSDPFFHSNLGSSDADVFLSLNVIGSVCLILWATNVACEDDNPYFNGRDWAFAAAAALLGAAAGLKLTYFVYATAMTGTLLVLWRPLGITVRRFLRFAGGGAGGYALTAGYWNLRMHELYGNPFMPYWNDIFHSRWIVESSFRDTRFPTGSLSGMLGFPFAWLRGEHPTSEGPFRIAVYAVLEVLIPVVALIALLKLLRTLRKDRKDKPGATPPTALITAPAAILFLLVFGALSYFLWAWMFAIQRYLEPIALLAGWMLWMVCDYLIPSRQLKLAVFALLALGCVLWMRGEDQGWRAAYGESWFGVKQLPAPLQEDGLMVIAIGGGPMSYLTPYLPASHTTVRLNELTIPLDGRATVLARRASLIIARHAGPIRSLSSMPLDDHARYYLARYGLALVEEECVNFFTDVTQFTSCALERRFAAPAFSNPSPLPR